MILDASHYNPVQDWVKVAKNLEAVILKCTQGRNYIDPTFKTNRENAHANGIQCLFYHFANGTDAIQEADFFLKTIGELKENEGVALDYEIHLADPVSWCRTFLYRCKEKTGVEPLIYINSSTAKAFNWSDVTNYPLWIASYGINDGKPHGSPVIGGWKNYTLWQYTSRGSCPGVNGYVDLSTGTIPTECLKTTPIVQETVKNVPTPNPEAYSDTAEQTYQSVEVKNDIPEIGKIIAENVQSTKKDWFDYIVELVANLFKKKS